MSTITRPISIFIATFMMVAVCLLCKPISAQTVYHNLLASSGIDSEELYLSRPLTPKEWDILGLKYIRTTVNGIEKYKVDLPALDMLDLVAKIGYRVVGMSRAPIIAGTRTRGHGTAEGGFWWTLVKETEE